MIQPNFVSQNLLDSKKTIGGLFLIRRIKNLQNRRIELEVAKEEI
jgi:hypothetical protein